MDIAMNATQSIAEPKTNGVELAFIDDGSTITVRIGLQEASRLARELDRAFGESAGIHVALSRNARSAA